MRTLSHKVADDAIIGQAISNSGLDRFRIDDVQLHPLRREVRDPFRAMATDDRDRAGTGHRNPCKRILKGPFEQKGVYGASLGTDLHEQVASGVKDRFLHATLVQGRMHGNKSVVRQVIALGRRGNRAIADLALPPRCGGCGAITEELHSFCIDCWPSIEWLVDDVLTTGSTAEACAKALLKAGAADVELICFARVVRPAVYAR